MKLATYTRASGDTPRLGAVTGRNLLDLASALAKADKPAETDLTALIACAETGDMCRFLALGGYRCPTVARAIETGESDEPPVTTDDVTLLAPVTRPGKIIGIGRNYGAHANEGGLERQERPRVLLKTPSSVTGPGSAIRKPPLVEKLDWEVELAVVIGRTISDIAEADAMDHVAGFTILNDVSAREFQFDVSPPQTSFAKSMDTFTPMGPWLVTPDVLPNPEQVKLSCHINGALMQEGMASDMIYSIPYLLSYLGRYMTLEPGDVLATGTPAGSGHFRTPPIRLEPGDHIRMEIPEIGILENFVT